MKKLKIKLQDSENPYVKTNIIDKNGNYKEIYVHGYLIGIEMAIALKKKNNLHGLIIITGNVGDGKSSMTEGLSGIDAQIHNSKLDFDNISWSTEKFIEKTDDENNIGQPLWWDEAIQGAGGRSMAISRLGNKLKMAFVTKRFKKHTYYLCIDEINEYSWKLIKMADAWIHINRIGMKRGYWKCYTKRYKIEFIYRAFKDYNKTWQSKEVKMINPDSKGKFNDFSGLFLDKTEYNKRKLDETKQMENEMDRRDKALINCIKLLKDKGLNYTQIAQHIGYSAEQVGRLARHTTTE